MYTSADDQPVVLTDEIWRGWVQKKKRRQQATARKYMRLAGIALGILTLLGSAAYLITPK